ncbi:MULTISPECIES: hypothetical protein [unclassified Fibrobacter]|uniref:hypothetical protein n=1 Tax=unclassified Fibrobacter TaxID=2634177 RepID=UPI0025C26D27|nr:MULTISPECIES: hypothetical protein [unclassified Fibrobacter]
MKKHACLIFCFFLWNCCPICGSDCFYTIEKSVDIAAVGKYYDMHYGLNGKWYTFVDDTLQEHYYKVFCLYIDSANAYNLSMPISVDAYITHENMTEKVDPFLVDTLTAVEGMLAIIVKRRIPEPSSRLKIVIMKDGIENVFEFDIVQKAYKSRHSRKWMSFISI